MHRAPPQVYNVPGCGASFKPLTSWLPLVWRNGVEEIMGANRRDQLSHLGWSAHANGRQLYCQWSACRSLLQSRRKMQAHDWVVVIRVAMQRSVAFCLSATSPLQDNLPMTRDWWLLSAAALSEQGAVKLSNEAANETYTAWHSCHNR